MRMIIVLVRFSMLEVQNLSVNYRIIRALEDVSLTLWLHNHLGRAMRSQHSIGLATVYRSLDAQKKIGLLQHRITLEGGGRCSL
jgi:Fe2+ or Zn2+ uptake regulation protein